MSAVHVATQVACFKLQDEMSKLFLILENTYIVGRQKQDQSFQISTALFDAELPQISTLYLYKL